MPSLFFSQDLEQHATREQRRLARSGNPANRRAVLDAHHQHQLADRAHMFADRELHASVSAKELAGKRHDKQLAKEREWRVRQRVALQRRAKFEREFVQGVVDKLENREGAIQRRNERRADLMAVYGDRGRLSYSNSCGQL